jgi:mRNA-degrading endonuclease toxin of MazEF toxin-antitoxin module
MTQRGDVVRVQYPFVGGGAGKKRPAVVVQCDQLNGKIQNTILAMITGTTSLIGWEPTPFLIDPTTPERASSGLTYPSAVKRENLITIDQRDILQTLGKLSDVLRLKIGECLKEVLEL